MEPGRIVVAAPNEAGRNFIRLLFCRSQYLRRLISMADIYMIATVVVLVVLMVGLGSWASNTIREGSDGR